jgi:hypothetical protein
MKSSPPADPGTIRISFQIPEDQWAEFEKLTVKQAVAPSSSYLDTSRTTIGRTAKPPATTQATQYG